MSERTQRLREALKAARGPLVITGHDAPDVDSVASCVLMKRLLDHWGMRARIALPTQADAQTRRVMPRFGIDVDALAGEIAAGDSLVLVDHHQAAHPGTVAACVDHHPTDFPPDVPYAQIEPAGACAVMVLRLLREAGAPVRREDEALAVTALYLDTIALRSAKISAEEAAWGRAQAKRLGLDEEWLIREGMHLQDMSLPAQVLAMRGKKIYDFGGQKVISTYLQAEAVDGEALDAILGVLREAVRAEEAALWVFLVHEPLAMRSTQYDITPDGRVAVRRFDYLASRGKDVMPLVERAMRKAGD